MGVGWKVVVGFVVDWVEVEWSVARFVGFGCGGVGFVGVVELVGCLVVRRLVGSGRSVGLGDVLADLDFEPDFDLGFVLGFDLRFGPGFGPKSDPELSLEPVLVPAPEPDLQPVPTDSAPNDSQVEPAAPAEPLVEPVEPVEPAEPLAPLAGHPAEPPTAAEQQLSVEPVNLVADQQLLVAEASAH